MEVMPAYLLAAPASAVGPTMTPPSGRSRLPPAPSRPPCDDPPAPTAPPVPVAAPAEPPFTVMAAAPPFSVGARALDPSAAAGLLTPPSLEHAASKRAWNKHAALVRSCSHRKLQ